MKQPKFAAGQTWSYRTRDHESASRAHIVGVEPVDNGRSIYHVFIDNLAVANPEAPRGLQSMLSHAPVSLETLEASLLEQLPDEEPELVGFAEGYDIWKQDYESGDAGFFLMPLDEIIQYVEDILTGIDQGG